MNRRFLVSLLALFLSSTALADEVRYYVENGVTYAETTRIVRRPVCETRMLERQQTVYRQQTKTEMRECQRTVQVPVTEYRRESRWVGRWNPFCANPYLVERTVPYTRWQARTELVQTPVVRTELVPETRTVQVPVLTRSIVEEPVVSRVVIAAPPAGAAPAVASQVRIGGVSKFDSDPPRQGVSSGWRAATETTRR